MVIGMGSMNYLTCQVIRKDVPLSSMKKQCKKRLLLNTLDAHSLADVRIFFFLDHVKFHNIAASRFANLV